MPWRPDSVKVSRPEEMVLTELHHISLKMNDQLLQNIESHCSKLSSLTNLGTVSTSFRFNSK